MVWGGGGRCSPAPVLLSKETLQSTARAGAPWMLCDPAKSLMPIKTHKTTAASLGWDRTGQAGGDEEDSLGAESLPQA